jgi:rare lipoprotein A
MNYQSKMTIFIFTTIPSLNNYLFILFIFIGPICIAQKDTSKWIGKASYYHVKFNGRKTSSGKLFNNDSLTAANNFLKLGTKVKVTNLKNKKSVVVTINDRMHARNKRLIDLSQEAAKQLGFIDEGVCMVSIELYYPPSSKSKRKKSIKKHLQNL